MGSGFAPRFFGSYRYEPAPGGFLRMNNPCLWTRWRGLVGQPHQLDLAGEDVPRHLELPGGHGAVPVGPLQRLRGRGPLVGVYLGTKRRIRKRYCGLAQTAGTTKGRPAKYGMNAGKSGYARYSTVQRRCLTNRPTARPPPMIASSASASNKKPDNTLNIFPACPWSLLIKRLLGTGTAQSGMCAPSIIPIAPTRINEKPPEGTALASVVPKAVFTG